MTRRAIPTARPNASHVSRFSDLERLPLEKSAKSVKAPRRRTPPRIAPSTMADVAATAGVSTASVSRVLNAPEKVSAELRTRVEAAVEKLAYVRHGSARALAARRFQTIGAVVPTLGVATFATGIDALQERLESQGFSLLVACAHYDPEAEARQIRKLLEHGIDGLVLVGQQRRPEIYNRLDAAGIPYACTYTLASQSGLCVGYDNADASRRMVDYLVQLGHRRFCLITSPTDNNDRIAARFAGALSVISQANLPAPEVVEAPYAVSEGRAALRSALDRDPRITAVVCTTDLHALGAVAEARVLGLPVPSRLSITGYDDLEIVAEIDPPLTTVHVPSREIGLRVADMLMATIIGRPTTQVVELSASIVVRGSTARAPDLGAK